MIDNFSLAVSHGLMLIAAWRLIFRRDLDTEAPPKPDAEATGFRKGRPRNA
jgi:hypothetical protein